ncbi:MAG: hypothetical protein Q7S94_01270, partial [Gallionella sp.]|nr:hypothetical protein [Gallionella sp.]
AKKWEKVNFKNQFLVHLSTVAVPKNSSLSWVNIQSAHWVTIRSASTPNGKINITHHRAEGNPQ